MMKETVKKSIGGKLIKDKLKDARLVFSIILISLLIPFLLFTSLPQYQTFAYNITFVTLLTIFLGALFFEITNVLIPHVPRTDDFWRSFIVNYFLFGVFFAFFTMNPLIKSYLGSSSLIKSLHLLSLFAGIFFVFIISLISNIFTSIQLRMQFTLTIVYLLSTLFLLFLTINGIVFLWPVLFLPIFASILTDSSAYLFGKKFGKTKFTSISPNKSLEGLIFGLAVGILFSLIWSFLLISTQWTKIGYQLILSNHLQSIFGLSITIKSISIWEILLLSFLIPIVSAFGDLFFSKIKREFNIKDFSKVLGGHGGLLDRIDSHIFATITTAVILLIFIK